MNANHVKRNLPYIIMAIPAVSIFSVFFREYETFSVK